MERDKERFCWQQKPIREAGFLAVFGPKFLHPWSMKIKSIYRQWKRDTLSLLVQNFSPWFDPKASQPLAQSSNDELSVLCRKNGQQGWPLWSGVTASTASISPKSLYQRVVRCREIVFMQVSFNLGKKRGVKRLGKEAPQAGPLKKKINSNFLANYTLVLQFVIYL